MLRVMFHMLAVLFIVLFVATVALWVRSYFVSDTYEREVGWRFLIVESSNGKIGYFNGWVAAMGGEEEWQDDFDIEPEVQWRTAEAGDVVFVPESIAPVTSLFGFVYYAGVIEGAHGPVLDARIVVVPYWFLALLFAVIPAWWMIVLVRGRRVRLRRAAGQCLKCGYDLRGLASGAACPECGAGRI